MTQAPVLLPLTYSSPLGDWFKELTGKAQIRIIEMVNEDGFPLDDVEDFVNEFGEKYLLDGTYEEWEKLSRNYSEEAIRGFVKLNGIHELTRKAFTDAYIGKYESGGKYAQEYNEANRDVPDDLVIDWESTWREHFMSDNEWVEPGYVFLQHW